MPEDTFKALHKLRLRTEKIHEYSEIIMDRIINTRGDVKAFLKSLKNIEYYVREIRKLSKIQGVEQH